jgi:hypothetical protein
MVFSAVRVLLMVVSLSVRKSVSQEVRCGSAGEEGVQPRRDRRLLGGNRVGLADRRRGRRLNSLGCLDALHGL